MGRKKTYCNTCDWELDKFESEHPSLHKKNKIDILLSTGGYMSLPLCFASKILNIKPRIYSVDNITLYKFSPNIVSDELNSNKIIELLTVDREDKVQPNQINNPNKTCI